MNDQRRKVVDSKPSLSANGPVLHLMHLQDMRSKSQNKRQADGCQASYILATYCRLIQASDMQGILVVGMNGRHRFPARLVERNALMSWHMLHRVPVPDETGGSHTADPTLLAFDKFS